MTYQIYPLKENLILITWFQRPHVRSTIEQDFIQDMARLLDESSQPLYIISDLRRGFIRNPIALRKLAKTLNHPNFASAAAFSNDIIVGIDYSIFLVSSRRYRFTPDHEASQLYSNLEGALDYLERQSPGLTHAIDWQAVFQAQA